MQCRIRTLLEPTAGETLEHQHVWEFFDSFPRYEIYECSVCKMRKFVNIDTGEETYEKPQ